MVRLFAVAFFMLAQLIGYAKAQAVPGCGSLTNSYGPYDYWSTQGQREAVPLIDRYHFTPDVEGLIRGASSSILGDLDYTLRAIPNYPRALAAMARYALQGGQFPPDAPIPSAECYFLRALAFVPNDPAVHEIYAYFLSKRGKRQQAQEQYEAALRLAPESAEINYNAGLFFLDIGDITQAKKLAQVAYAAGYPLPGLRKRLAAAEANLSKQRPTPP